MLVDLDLPAKPAKGEKVAFYLDKEETQWVTKVVTDVTHNAPHRGIGAVIVLTVHDVPPEDG